MSEFKEYRRKQIANLRPYEEGETLSDRVSISASDKEGGSPKVGDMIARNPKDHQDQWLVAAQYFEDNFEEVGDAPPVEANEIISGMIVQLKSGGPRMTVSEIGADGTVRCMYFCPSHNDFKAGWFTAASILKY